MKMNKFYFLNKNYTETPTINYFYKYYSTIILYEHLKLLFIVNSKTILSY